VLRARRTCCVLNVMPMTTSPRHFTPRVLGRVSCASATFAPVGRGGGARVGDGACGQLVAVLFRRWRSGDPLQVSSRPSL
jgi:hypothetical protein